MGAFILETAIFVRGVRARFVALAVMRVATAAVAIGFVLVILAAESPIFG